MGPLGTTEILIILAVVVLLFGSTKLPSLARSLGKSARILKAETRGLREDDEKEKARPAAAPKQELPSADEEVIDGVPVTDAERERKANS